MTDELSYELMIRGLPVGSTVAEKRTQLREALGVERQQGVSITTSRVHLEATQELNICQQKLEDLEQDIAEFDQQNRNNEFKRINSRLIHISNRLGRISGNNVDQEIRRLALIHKNTQLMGNLNLEYEGLERSNVGVSRNIPPTLASECSRSILDEDNPRIHENIMLPAGVSFDLVQLEEATYGQTSPIDLRANFVSEGGDMLVDQHCREGVYDSERYSREAPPQSGSISAVRQQYLPSKRIIEPLDSLELLECQFNRLSTTRNSNIPSRKGPLQDPYPERSGIARNRSDSHVHFTPVENSSQFIDRNWSRQAAPPTPSRNTSICPEPNVAGFVPEDYTLPPDRKNAIYSSNFGSPVTEGRHPDVSRWNVKFTGRNSVSDFLERVEELSNSRGVSKAQLLRSAPELFSQEALWWYRTNNFDDWDELTKKLKEDYLPYDYENVLWDEIRHRTQGAQERVLTFVIAMESLFRKLPTPPPEEVRVNLIRRNFLPHIQKQLALQEVNSSKELIRLARAVEEADLRAQRFVPPPASTRGLLEPELAYRRGHCNQPLVAAVTNDERQPERKTTGREIEAVSDVSQSAQPSICWNCNSGAHKFRSCPELRKKFCFRCGYPNVVVDTCPKCKKNLKAGRQ